MREHVGAWSYGAAIKLRQLWADASGAKRLYTADDGRRGATGRLRLFVCGYVRRLYGGFGVIDCAVESAPHWSRSIRGPFAVRGSNQRCRTGLTGYRGEWARAGGVRLPVAGKSGGTAWGLSMPATGGRR